MIRVTIILILIVTKSFNLYCNTFLSSNVNHIDFDYIYNSKLLNNSINKNNLISLNYHIYESELKELNPISLSYLHKFDDFYMIGTNIKSRGSDLFRENRLSLLNSLQFGELFDIIMTINYNSLFIKSFNNHTKWDFDLGGQVSIYDNTIFEFKISNLIGEGYLDEMSLFASDRVICFGVSHFTKVDVNLKFHTLIAENRDIGISIELEKEIFNFLDVLINYNSYKNYSKARVAYNNDNFVIFFGINYASYIGYTTDISLLFHF